MTEDSKSKSVEKKRPKTTDNLSKSISSVENTDDTVIIFNKQQSCLALNPIKLKYVGYGSKSSLLTDGIETLKKWIVEQIERLRESKQLFIQNSASLLSIKKIKLTEFHYVECSICITVNKRESERLQELMPKIQQLALSTGKDSGQSARSSLIKKFLIQIQALQQELQKLKQEKQTLETILERVVEQANLNESQLQKTILEQQKAQAILLEINQELETLIFTDDLTQIANRRKFDDYLQQEWQKLRQKSAFLCLVLCDIDYFKVYNDTYGHLIGDYCLQQVALTLESIADTHDGLAARYGGEEFGIILPNIEKERAVAIANLMRSTVRSLKIEHQNSPVYRYVTLSLGIYSFIPSSNSTPELAIAKADRALYEAKERGRDRACVYGD